MNDRDTIPCPPPDEEQAESTTFDPEVTYIDLCCEALEED